MIMRSRRRRSQEVALALLAFLPAWGALVAGLYVTVTDSSTGPSPPSDTGARTAFWCCCAPRAFVENRAAPGADLLQAVGHVS